MIECICVNDSYRHPAIPESKWIKKGEVYHVTEIMSMRKQGGLLGVVLYEIDLSDYSPVEYFRMDRFNFRSADLPKIMKLIRDCRVLSEIKEGDIQGLLKDKEPNGEDNSDLVSGQ